MTTVSLDSRGHSAGNGWNNSGSTSTRPSPRRSPDPAAPSAAARTAGTWRSTRRRCSGSSTSPPTPGSRPSAAAILGPDYQIVEVGFDVPEPGAVNQPWHRDFPMPAETARHRKLTSLAFNITAVDTTDDMGPFEIAPGTQWDTGEDFEHGMFPPKDLYPRFEERAVRKYPQMGDISARSALTIHRGTINHSARSRPVLVVGVDAPGAGNAERHDLSVTRDYFEHLPVGPSANT